MAYTSSELEEKYHDSVATKYTHRRIYDYIWEVPEEIFLLRKELFSSRVKVVDMGCGPAVTVSRILRSSLKFIDYTGVDISKKLLSFARKNVRRGKYIYSDISTVKFPKNTFDVLLSLGALHHCENKMRTLARWFTFVKPGGYLIFREPLYEFLKRGTGESPIEEGIKIEEFMMFVKRNKLNIIRFTFFSTNAFHLFNRIMIKIGLKSWQQARVLWYPVVYFDSLLAKFSHYGNLFKPQAFAVILQKQ